MVWHRAHLRVDTVVADVRLVLEAEGLHSEGATNEAQAVGTWSGGGPPQRQRTFQSLKIVARREPAGASLGSVGPRTCGQQAAGSLASIP